MGLAITLPLGMSVGDISVGSYTHMGGNEYLAQNIDLTPIKNLLGTGSADLTLVSLSNNINFWAAFKPHEIGGSGLYRSGMKYVSSDIVWDRPGGAAQRDLTHFAGYNHNAPTPEVISHDDLSISYESAGTYTISVTFRLPEFDIRDIPGGTSIEKLYSKTYVEESLQRTDSLAITSTHVTNKQITIDSKVNLAGSEYLTVFEFRYYLGNDVTNNLNFPTEVGGTYYLTGYGFHQVPPIATLELGTTFAPETTIHLPIADVDTARGYMVAFGDQNEWIRLPNNNTYDGPFTITAHNPGKWVYEVVRNQNVNVGFNPAYEANGQLPIAYTIAVEDTVNFILDITNTTNPTSSVSLGSSFDGYTLVYSTSSVNVNGEWAVGIGNESGHIQDGASNDYPDPIKITAINPGKWSKLVVFDTTLWSGFTNNFSGTFLIDEGHQVVHGDNIEFVIDKDN